jgi:cathepsin L
MEESDYKFMRFVVEHGKSYGTKEEYNFRSNIFKKNLAVVETHNNKIGQNFTLGTNYMSDYTEDEWKHMNGYKHELKTESNIVRLDESNLAGDVDWRTKNAVTPVKNQGNCGSCWSFSTTGSIEGAEAIATGTLTSYSEQQLVDCAGGKWGNMGCKGGLMDSAFKYVEENPLETESEYPYTAKKDFFCHYKKEEGVGKVAGFNDVTPNSVAQLKAAIDKGPVSVAIEADKSVF